MIAALSRAATAITRVLGEAGTYTVKSPASTISMRVVISRDVQSPINPMSPMIIERRTVLTVRAADLSGVVPKLGDTVTVGSEVWTVLAIDRDDGYLIKLRVRAGT